MYKYLHGVYAIINKINQKQYIGSCGNKYGFKARFRQHKWELLQGTHPNKHLQRAWKKYGQESFNFVILEVTKQSDAVLREQHYIDTLKPQYNIALRAGSTLGVKLSPETCARIGASKRGIKYTQEQIQFKCKKVQDQYGTIYPSISAAARSIGSHLSCIQNVLRGKHAQALGYKFSYVKTGEPNNE